MKGMPTHGASTLVFLGLLAAVGIGALVSTAHATAPGKNGGIAFKRYLDGGRSTGAIFTVDASGKAERQITMPEAGVVDDQPDWSPDGSLLVFHRSVPDSPFAIYTVKQDGSGLTRVSPPSEDGVGPSFLPDGKQIVYTRATGSERHFPGWGNQIQHSDLVVRDVIGANPRVVVGSRPYAGDYLSAQFSPDGSRLVYVRSNSPLTNFAGAHALFVVRADGSSQRRITPWTLDAGDNPDWSPNGKLILFRSYEGGAKQSQSPSSGRTAADCGRSRASRRGRPSSPTPSHPTGSGSPSPSQDAAGSPTSSSSGRTEKTSGRSHEGTLWDIAPIGELPASDVERRPDSRDAPQEGTRLDQQTRHPRRDRPDRPSASGRHMLLLHRMRSRPEAVIDGFRSPAAPVESSSPASDEGPFSASFPFCSTGYAVDLEWLGPLGLVHGMRQFSCSDGSGSITARQRVLQTDLNTYLKGDWKIVDEPGRTASCGGRAHSQPSWVATTSQRGRSVRPGTASSTSTTRLRRSPSQR